MDAALDPNPRNAFPIFLLLVGIVLAIAGPSSVFADVGTVLSVRDMERSRNPSNFEVKLLLADGTIASHTYYGSQKEIDAFPVGKAVSSEGFRKVEPDPEYCSQWRAKRGLCEAVGFQKELLDEARADWR